MKERGGGGQSSAIEFIVVNPWNECSQHFTKIPWQAVTNHCAFLNSKGNITKWHAFDKPVTWLHWQDLSLLIVSSKVRNSLPFQCLQLPEQPQYAENDVYSSKVDRLFCFLKTQGHRLNDRQCSKTLPFFFNLKIRYQLSWHQLLILKTLTEAFFGFGLILLF